MQPDVHHNEHDPTSDVPTTDPLIVLVWLYGVYLMIFLMVIIGGTTRLTGSGLSMVQWRPLIGTVPPLSEQDWLQVFDEYKQFPQYQQVNSWMDLAAFKKIFFWEYLHRLFGRLIGVVVVVPWLFFWLRGQLSKGTSWRALGAVFLGGCQGLLGWYMVKSGLVNVPEVSHFRLAAHLLLALICSQWVLWAALQIRAPWRRAESRGGAARSTNDTFPLGKKAPLVLLGVLYLQITYGALVAGKRAGYMSATFPDMNGHYLPGEFFTASTLAQNLFENPLSLHYLHRLIGTLVLILFVGAGVWLIKKGRDSTDRKWGWALLAMVGLQFTLGVTTVIFVVPLVSAVAHQGGGVILLGLTTALVHRAYRPLPPLDESARLPKKDDAGAVLGAGTRPSPSASSQRPPPGDAPATA